MKILISVALLLASLCVSSAHAGQADQLNQRCAPCHGLYGQGAPGENMPRLAGLPAWYLAKASKDYVKDTRKNALMMEVSGLKDMTEPEIESLSNWLSKLDVGKDPTYDIKMLKGNAQAGEKKFRMDCRDCHAKDGYGKKKDDAPPLAGQYPGYLLTSIKAFFRKDRHHDNDPIDDTFHDISDAQSNDILAWTASLDDAKQQADYQFQPTPLPKVVPDNTGFKVSSVQQMVMSTVVKQGVTMPQAIAAMLAKATELEVPEIPEQPNESAELPTVIDLKFCAPQHINKLISAMPVIASYDPCRVTMVMDPEAGLQLMTVNLDMLTNGKQLSTDAQRIAIQINQDMLAIISAGVNGSDETTLAEPAHKQR